MKPTPYTMPGSGTMCGLSGWGMASPGALNEHLVMVADDVQTFLRVSVPTKKGGIVTWPFDPPIDMKAGATVWITHFEFEEKGR